MRDSIFHMINDYIENTVDAEVSVDQDYEDWDLIELNRVNRSGHSDGTGDTG